MNKFMFYVLLFCSIATQAVSGNECQEKLIGLINNNISQATAQNQFEFILDQQINYLDNIPEQTRDIFSNKICSIKKKLSDSFLDKVKNSQKLSLNQDQKNKLNITKPIPIDAFEFLITDTTKKTDLTEQINSYKATVAWAKAQDKIFSKEEQRDFIWHHLWPLYNKIENIEQDNKKELQTSLLKVLSKTKKYKNLSGDFAIAMKKSMIKPLIKQGITIEDQKAIKIALKAKKGRTGKTIIIEEVQEYPAIRRSRRRRGGRFSGGPSTSRKITVKKG